MTKSNKKTFVMILTLCTVIFAVVLFLVLTKNQYLQNFDNAISQNLKNNRLRFFDYFFVILSYMGETKIIAIICLILILLPNRKKLGIPITIFTILSACINFAIKYIVARTRPENLFLEQATLGYAFPTGYSFPSGHAQTSTVFYMSLALQLYKNYCFSKSTKIITIVSFSTLCLLICFGRIYLGVHFFSDVLSGILIATIILITSIIYKLPYKDCISYTE